MDEWRIVSDHPIYSINDRGEVLNTSTGKLLKPRSMNGYSYVTLCDENGHHQVGIHRLVAKAFISNPDDKPQVNHIDGNRKNNNINNLEWCTRSENMKHAYRTGLQKPIPAQIKYSLSKAVDALKRPVRNVETGKCYPSLAECAKAERISPSAVSFHVTGRAKHYRFEYVGEEVGYNG